MEAKYYELYSEDYKDVLYLSLEKFMDNDVILHDDNKRTGVLRRKGDIIYFAPYEKRNMPLTLSNARITTRKKLKAINITNFKDHIRTKKKSRVDKTMIEIEALLAVITSMKLKLISDENKYETAYKTKLVLMAKNYDTIAFDYLNSDYKEPLIKAVITSRNREHLKLVDANIIYTNRDYNTSLTGKDTSSKGEDTIWGYKIVRNGKLYYMKNATAEFTSATHSDIKQINKRTNLRITKENKTNTIIGYLEEKITLGKKTISIKIRDKTTEGDKGTHIITGSVCGNDGMKKAKIRDFIHKVLNNNRYANYKPRDVPGKPNLCNELELYLRNNEAENKNNTRWFYTQEEALERGLNKKK